MLTKYGVYQNGLCRGICAGFLVWFSIVLASDQSPDVQITGVDSTVEKISENQLFQLVIIARTKIGSYSDCENRQSIKQSYLCRRLDITRVLLKLGSITQTTVGFCALIFKLDRRWWFIA